MKAFALYLLLWCSLLAGEPVPVSALNQPIPELTLKDGRVLKQVQLVSFAGTTVMARWEGGRGTIAYQNFPDDYQPALAQLRPNAQATSAPTPARASAPGALSTAKTWQFGDGTVFRLNLPEGATCEQVSPSSDTLRQAFTLAMPDANSTSTISYQFLVTKAEGTSEWSTLEQVDAFLLKAGKPGLQQAVEKELRPVHLAMKHGVGGYLVFTDPALVGQSITRPRMYRYMTMVACGVGGYNIFVRGYTNSVQESYFKRIHQMIEGAEVIKK